MLGLIPNSYTRIAVNATQSCDFVQEYVLSSNLTEIGGLDGICKSLTLPNSLTSLSGWIRGMFKTLTIPSAVTNLDGIDAPLLETLTIASNNLSYNDNQLRIPGCKYITGFQNIQRFNGYLPSLLRVDSNEDGVLNLRGLTMSNGPLFGDGMGNNAHTINFEYLESVDSQMLDRCPNMKNVTLPATLTSLSDIEMSLGSNIETLTLLSTTPPELGFGLPMVNGRPRLAIYLNAIYVPAGSVQAYKEATNWLIYADLIKGDPNNEGQGPTPEPEPGEHGVFFVDTTTGVSYEMSDYDGRGVRFQYENFYFEQGHEYEFRVNMGEGNYQGWNAGTRKATGFPDGNGTTYIGFKENSLYVLRSFIGRPRIDFYTGYNLGEQTTSSMRWTQDV